MQMTCVVVVCVFIDITICNVTVHANNMMITLMRAF